MEVGQKSCSVSFNIVFDEKVTKKCPKKNQKTKEPLTLSQIEQKLLLAEKRRQCRIAARLKRMEEREAATKKLAESVDILLQQQSLRNGELGSSSKVSKMSQREIMKTANDVACRFKIMQQQLLGMHLKIDEKTPAIRNKRTENKECKDYSNATSAKSGQITDDGKQNKAIYFEIPLEKEVKKLKQPKISMKENTSKCGRKLIVEELNEKLQRATERKQKIMEERARKTREGREALMKLRTKINVYAEHHNAMEKGNAGAMLSEHDAACLAQEISDGFNNIASRYKSSLDRADGFCMFYY